MPRTAAFWEERREAAAQLAVWTGHKRRTVLLRIVGLQRKLRRLNQGFRVTSFSRRAWKQPYTKDMLVALISTDRALATRYQYQCQKYERRVLYCEAMLKRCREKTLWDAVRQKPAF